MFKTALHINASTGPRKNPKAASGDFGGKENRIVENARERAAGAASPT